jgi:hypothetical protein
MSLEFIHRLPPQYSFEQIKKAVEAVNKVAQREAVKPMGVYAEAGDGFIDIYVKNPGFNIGAEMLSIGILIGQELNTPKDRFIEIERKEKEEVIPEPFKVGDYVHYHDGHSTANGRLKWIAERPEPFEHDGKPVYGMRIVVHCNNDWNSYQDYTGQLTDSRYIFHGWVEPSAPHITIPTPANEDYDG